MSSGAGSGAQESSGLRSLPIKVAEVEEVWHALAPPYGALFAWLSGGAPRPDPGQMPSFRPLMLATPLEDVDLATLDPAAYRAEWKWDGIRVQLVARHGQRRIYTRTGDEILELFDQLGREQAVNWARYQERCAGAVG